MSTSYYKLRGPYTHIKITESARGPEWCRIELMAEGEFAGEMILRHEEVYNVIKNFAEASYDDSQAALRTHWGGKERGAIVTVQDESLADDVTVISEYGDILTVGEVKARDGAHRQDGYPTELFGYEK